MKNIIRKVFSQYLSLCFLLTYKQAQNTMEPADHEHKVKIVTYNNEVFMCV